MRGQLGAVLAVVLSLHHGVVYGDDARPAGPGKSAKARPGSTSPDSRAPGATSGESHPAPPGSSEPAPRLKPGAPAGAVPTPPGGDVPGPSIDPRGPVAPPELIDPSELVVPPSPNDPPDPDDSILPDRPNLNDPPSPNDDDPPWGVRPPADGAGGESVSCGSANRGALSNGVELPRRGVGYEIPEPWWLRGYRYGTGELVGLIVRSATAVAAEHPGGVVGVADLSQHGGGAVPRHRSHQSGRDVDIIYYAVDAEGNPLQPDAYMGYYARNGRAYYAQAPEWTRHIPERHFDIARNWALVKALLGDPETRVELILVSRRIRRWLLQYASSIGESEGLMRRAAVALNRGPAAVRHNDHMHVRIACTAADVAAGRCRNSLARSRRGGRKWHSRMRCPRRPTTVTQAVPAPPPGIPLAAGD